MRPSIRALALAIVMAQSLGTTGCAYSIHQQYISSMDPKARVGQGHWVEAEATKFVVLGFAFNSDYVDHAYKQLQDKCKGRLAQVTTQHLTAFKFLSCDMKVLMRGQCMG